MYTVRQTFLAENDGELPVELYDFYIGDTPCQSYGFRVVNCSSFTIQPNESHRIEVAFTPDFSLFHVEQFLVIRTSLTGVSPSLSRKRENVTIDPNGNLLLRLVATVSSHAVAKCGEKIPRPPWEPLLYYSVVTLLVAMFCGTVVRAILEAEHTLKTTFVPMTTVVPVDQVPPSFDRNKVFDLKAIGSMESEEVQVNTASSPSQSDKVKNHVNSVAPKKVVSNAHHNPSANAIHNNNHIPYNANKSKLLGKLSSINSHSNSYANERHSEANNHHAHQNHHPNHYSHSQSFKRVSDSAKNNSKMSLSFSSILSLPFGLNKKHNSGSNAGGPHHSYRQHHNPKQRKNSQKEHHIEQYSSSSFDSKTQNEAEFSSTTTEGSSVDDDICVYIKKVRIKD